MTNFQPVYPTISYVVPLNTIYHLLKAFGLVFIAAGGKADYQNGKQQQKKWWTHSEIF